MGGGAHYIDLGPGPCAFAWDSALGLLPVQTAQTLQTMQTANCKPYKHCKPHAPKPKAELHSPQCRAGIGHQLSDTIFQFQSDSGAPPFNSLYYSRH